MRSLVWPRSWWGWSLYGLIWLTYALGWVALAWIRDGGPSWQTTLGAARLMFPAALLGVGVLALSARIDLAGGPSLRTITPHVLGALVYPVLWVATVSGSAALMAGLSSGAWRWRLPPEHVLHWHFLSGVLIYVTLAAVSYGLEVSRRADSARLRAEWHLLRAQLSPHFLFNTLHTLIALVRADGKRGEYGVECFSRVLRFTLSVNRHQREWVSVAEEWAFASDYLALEELRHGGRLWWEAKVSPEALRCALPPILIQPLLENALRFAVEPRTEGARLMIQAEVQDGKLVLRVADDGPGCDVTDAARSAGIGLRSIRARLDALTPGVGHLRIESSPGRGFTAMVILPAIPAEWVARETGTVRG